MDMLEDSTENQVRAVPPFGVFRTMDNALQPGWHIWQTNYAHPGGQDWRDTGLCCETAIIDTA